MKIIEVTQTKPTTVNIRQNTANKLVVNDPITGTTTTFDKKKNPNAIVHVDPKTPNQGTMKNPMATKNDTKKTKTNTAKPGTKVKIVP